MSGSLRVRPVVARSFHPPTEGSTLESRLSHCQPDTSARSAIIPAARSALAHEEIETYDASYYETQLVRAVESVLSTLGLDRTETRRELAETREANVTAFTEVGGS